MRFKYDGISSTNQNAIKMQDKCDLRIKLCTPCNKHGYLPKHDGTGARCSLGDGNHRLESSCLPQKKHDQQHAVPTSRTMACVYPFHLVHNLHAHAPSKMFTGHLFLSATKHSAKLIPSPGCLPVVRVLNRTNQAVCPLFIKIRCKLAKRCDGHVGRKERIP